MSGWRILAPLAWARGWSLARQGPGASIGVPVVALGPLSAPVAAQAAVALALAQAMGGGVHVLCSGPDRGRIEGHETDPDVSAEALLLAPFVPVWQGGDPVAMGATARRNGAHALLWLASPADRRLAAKRVLLVDPARGFGNGRLWPAGPLVWPLDAALAEAVAIIATGPQAADFLQDQGHSFAPDMAFSAVLEPVQTGMTWQALRVLAVTGAGRARDFLPALRAMGADLVRSVVLEDDQPLASALLTRLLREAAHQRAQLVTTEAEALRLPQALRPQVLTLPLRARIEGVERVIARLAL